MKAHSNIRWKETALPISPSGSFNGRRQGLPNFKFQVSERLKQSVDRNDNKKSIKRNK